LLRKRTGEEFGADVVAHTGKPKEAPDSATWELIVVDNGSTDGTRIASEDFAAAFAQPVRLVYERTPGQGNARNAGWKSAEAQIVAYLDDDCYPADDYLDAVVECFAEAPNLGFISGRGSYCRASDLSVRILNVYPSAAGSLLFLLNMHRLIIEPRPHEKNYWRDLWRTLLFSCMAGHSRTLQADCYGHGLGAASAVSYHGYLDRGLRKDRQSSFRWYSVPHPRLRCNAAVAVLLEFAGGSKL
jgi:glycosyltransferase involved in cell wall biosynthesis